MKIKLYFILLIPLLVPKLNAQDSLNFNIEPLRSLVSTDDKILTYLNGNASYILSPVHEDYISSWNRSSESNLKGTQILSTEADLANPIYQYLDLGLSKNEEIGTVSYCPGDSSYVYSSTKEGRSSIYKIKIYAERELLLKATGKTQYFHPFISSDGSQIFFSSNFENNVENYDLFYLNKLDEGWSTPIRIGPEINTEYDEVFPTWYNDTLYFSTNISGNLDIYKTPKSSQYKSKQKMESPFNSDQDDFLLHKKNDQIFYLTSNRKANTDQPFLLEKKIIKSVEKSMISGFLACAGNRISNVPVILTNSFGIKIDEDLTDSDGNFLFRSDKSLKKYRLKLGKKDPRTKDCAVLYLTDKNGNVVQKIMINDEGDFNFETIETDEVGALNMLSVEDESLLQIEIEGQVFENEPGDIGKGTPIRILDDEGNLIALAYTNEEGKFSFDNLSPESEYTFSFDGDSEQLQLIVIKNGIQEKVPVVDNQAVFHRINKEQAVELIDDKGRKIAIEKDEFFELQNIFYEYNSAELSSIAMFQLDRLAQFIFNNDEIIIELTSHTDSRGQDDYNKMLSEKRAKAAIDYLVSKGVRPSRMKGYGMGEKEPINLCYDGRECTEAEHALNRRTEIRIIVLD